MKAQVEVIKRFHFDGQDCFEFRVIVPISGYRKDKTYLSVADFQKAFEIRSDMMERLLNGHFHYNGQAQFLEMTSEGHYLLDIPENETH